MVEYKATVEFILLTDVKSHILHENLLYYLCKFKKNRTNELSVVILTERQRLELFTSMAIDRVKSQSC